MKRSRANKLLGIAMGEKSLLVAEVHAHNGRGLELVQAAEFVYPESAGLDRAAELGKALATFLKGKGFALHHAVIGLPAKWILTRRKELPPATETSAASVLRLSAESEFASEIKDLVIDYIGQPSASAATSAMVMATSRERIAQCQTLAAGAKLHLEGITATGTALLCLENGQQNKAMVLSLAPVGNELVIHENGSPLQLRHLALTNGQAEVPGAIVGELRRAVAGISGDAPSLSVWAGAGLSASIQAEVAEKLSLTLRPPRLSVADPTGVGSSFAPAIAVALAAMREQPRMVDFLHSRLAVAPVRRSRRPMVWAGALAGTALLASLIAWFDLHSMESDLDAIQVHLKADEADIRAAETAADWLSAARDFTTGKPRYLACLADLTALFPDEGSIWATALTLRTDLSGQLSGRASSEQQVLALLDKIKDGKRFADVKIGEMRDAGRNSREIAFSVSFTYRPE